MGLSPSNIALSIDVWNVIESELETGLLDVSLVILHYYAESGDVVLAVNHSVDKGESLLVRGEKADGLMSAVCDRFNIDTFNLNKMFIKLSPGEVPLFNIHCYPYVDDYTTLEENANRLNAKTIN